MMESARHGTQALPTGVAASTLLHLVTIAYLVLWIARPPVQVERPVDLSHAIPILMPQPKPEPPKPEPPKPRPKEPPKPVPTPDVIETAAAQQAVETPAVKPPPPPEDQPRAEPEPPPASATPYASYVLGVIEREKRYPREALMSGDQGVAIVSFVINRHGTVLAFTLEKRTGSSSLDGEVKRLMRRIQRFPEVPEGEFVGQERIKFEVPVAFRLTD